MASLKFETLETERIAGKYAKLARRRLPHPESNVSQSIFGRGYEGEGFWREREFTYSGCVCIGSFSRRHDCQHRGKLAGMRQSREFQFLAQPLEWAKK
jgi:hypothetical protein